MSLSNVKPAWVAAGGNLLGSGSASGAARAETAANANAVTNVVVEYLIIIQVNQVSTADNRKSPLVTSFSLTRIFRSTAASTQFSLDAFHLPARGSGVRKRWWCAGKRDKGVQERANGRQIFRDSFAKHLAARLVYESRTF
jgi:hypothetical protein